MYELGFEAAGWRLDCFQSHKTADLNGKIVTECCERIRRRNNQLRSWNCCNNGDRMKPQQYPKFVLPDNNNILHLAAISSLNVANHSIVDWD